MAGVTTALAVGALAAGGAMSAKSQSDAAKRAAGMAQFNPWDLNAAGGIVNFNNGQINAQLDPTQQMFGNFFTNNFQAMANGGGYGTQAWQAAEALGSNALPGVFQGAMDASQMIPTEAFNLFSGNAANQAAWGQNAGMNAMAMAGNFGGQQTGINEGLAQGLFGRANELMAQDFTGLANDQLMRARQLARPAEERAVNSKFQNLYNRGVLSQTGGERQIGELALAQEQADIQRQFGADQFAQQQLGMNRQFATNLLSQGLQGRSMDQSFNLGAGNLFANMGNQMLGYGAGQAQSALGAQVQMSDMFNTRGQQRLANVQQLLGFGSGLQQNNLNQMLSMFGASSQQNADLRNLIALGINAGGQQASAGAAAGNLYMQGAGNSPFGSFLSGLGGGFMTPGAGIIPTASS